MKIDNFKIEEWFNKYESSAIYDLADTCVESLSIDELFEIVGDREQHLKELFSKKLNYGEIFGSQRLKSAISTLYKKQNPSNITITHGAIGANHLVMLSLVEPGDNVVSIIPTYQQHYSIPKSFGANVRLLYLKEEDNWLPDLIELERLVDSNTKMICLNNPNNPTGAVIPDDMLEQIVDIARENSAYILSDEVYRGLNHDGSVSISIADIYDKGISTCSMSKVFSLAGLRLGWVVANKKIIEVINHQREYNTISVSILDDYIATLAIENKDKIISRNLKMINEGRKTLLSWAKSEPKIHLIPPQGGTTAFIRYDLAMSSVDLCENLQLDTGVMILPGQTLEYDKYLRIGFGNNPEKLKKALTIFSQWLNHQSN